MSTKLTTNINCPSCKRSLSMRIEDMRPGTRKQCLCGANIAFTGDDGRNVQKVIDDFEKSLKKMFK